MSAPNLLPQSGVRIRQLLTVAGATLTMSMPVSADLSPALDRLSVSVGVFRADPKFDVSVNTPYGVLRSGDIGLNKESIPRIKADLMIFDSQGLSLDYYQLKRNYVGTVSNNTLGSDLTTVGNANLDLQLDFAKLAYKWWLGSGNTVLGLGAGAAYYKVALNAGATASIGGSTAAINSGYDNNAVAPLLELGLRHAVSPQLRVFADLSGTKKSSGKLTGEIYNAAVGVEWFPIKNVGLVLDYGKSKINLNRQDVVDLNLNFKIQGPSAFLKVRY